MKRDRRLNPCDCILLGLDYHMRRQGYPGTSTCIALDAVGTLEYLFNGGRLPPAPGPHECGPDPNDDGCPECEYESC